INSILLNTISAVQRSTRCEMISFSGEGKSELTFQPASYLALEEANLVQVREPDGRWKDWERKETLAASGPADLHYMLAKDKVKREVAIIFGDNSKGKIPPQGTNNIRLISCLFEFSQRHVLGRSNGLPNQVFPLDQATVIPESLALQVEEKVKENG